MAKRRRALSRRKSRRSFRKSAGVRKKNLRATPARGGFRI